VILSVCVAVKLVSALGGGAAAEGFLYKLVSREDVALGILDFERGTPVASGFNTLLTVFASNPDEELGEEPEQAATSGLTADWTPETPTPATAPSTGPAEGSEVGGRFYSGEELTPPPASGVRAPRDNTQKLPADGILIQNNSDYEVDAGALLSEPLNLALTPGAPSVLILHTHSSEAYAPDGEDAYEESDPFRTEDKRYNIIRVGDALTARLAARGVPVIHDRNVYDYPSYTGSYNRSGEAIEAYLEKYPSIRLVIDLHRDAITASDGTQYKTIAQIGDTTCSQVMFVIGTGSAGLAHPGWRENMKLALRLQAEMNEVYPTLTRPVTMSAYRYNQQLAPGALIVEIGATGNTLRESVTAAGFFADAYANVVLGLYNK
jgi:stage II sporulation protein P